MADILERDFQARLIKRIKEEFPGCVVVKNDPNYLQGFPDLLILHGKHWAVLEAKRDEHAPHRPNQDHYIRMLDEMSCARFIYPENEEEILHDIREALGAGGDARIPQPE